jgi:hypothetical protein
MVTMDEVVTQFRNLKIKPSFWVKPEIKELTHILVPNEHIVHAVSGWYEGGMALLCCTNQRVLLIDKKFLYLNVEDLHYDKIAEVRYQYKMMDAFMRLTYAGRTLSFRSWNQTQLRNLVTFIQESIMEIRKLQMRDEQAWMYRTPTFTTQPSGLISAPTDDKSLPQSHLMIEPEALQPDREPPTITLTQTLPRNPYITRPLARHKLSRFVTTNQLTN